jgi:hypothetical protein
VVARLNRNEVLQGILRSLVAGWGYSAVLASLETLESEEQTTSKSPSGRSAKDELSPAVSLVNELDIPSGRKALLQTLAIHYDEGSAFPKLGDGRAFLLSHHRDAKDIKNRSQAFKRMLPLLVKMSEKGLEKVIARSHHSGPAELEPISKAIRGAGETLRGPISTGPMPAPNDSADRNSTGSAETSTETNKDVGKTHT